jgi:hypothetical protein
MAQKSLPITPGQKYKFVVKSAEEAAAIIRDKLGEMAQVISVRQVEGEGLARFLKSPKLEIIAQIPPEPEPAPAPDPAANALDSSNSTDDSSAAQDSSSRKKNIRPRKPRPATEPRREETDYVSESLVRAMFNHLPTGRLWTILSKAGIPTEFLAQIGERPETRGLNDQPLQTAISRPTLRPTSLSMGMWEPPRARGGFTA